MDFDAFKFEDKQTVKWCKKWATERVVPEGGVVITNAQYEQYEDSSH